MNPPGTCISVILRLAMLTALVGPVGCGVVLSTATVSDPKSMLKAIRTSPDRVTLEIFQVRVPADDQEFNTELWQAVDEQRLPLEERDRLLSNGFRAGVLSGSVPDVLAEVLHLQGEMPEDEVQRVITSQSATPKVTRRVLQLKRDEPATIQASEVAREVNVLLNTEHGLEGRSYEQVQGVYTLFGEAVPGQRVRVELTPELQYGELKNRYTGSDQGIFVLTPSRERRVFEQLKMSASLAAGEILLVSGSDDASGCLGHVFHALQQSGRTERKLILIRLLQTPESEILADASH